VRACKAGADGCAELRWPTAGLRIVSSALLRRAWLRRNCRAQPAPELQSAARHFPSKPSQKHWGRPRWGRGRPGRAVAHGDTDQWPGCGSFYRLGFDALGCSSSTPGAHIEDDRTAQWRTPSIERTAQWHTSNIEHRDTYTHTYTQASINSFGTKPLTNLPERASSTHRQQRLCQQDYSRVFHATRMPWVPAPHADAGGRTLGPSQGCPVNCPRKACHKAERRVGV